MSTLDQSVADRSTVPDPAMTRAWPGGRVAALSAIISFLFMAASGFLFFAAAGFSAQVNSDPAALVAVGGNGPTLVRWASMVDLLGYLALAPVVVYLRRRFHADPLNDLCAASGYTYILVGAIGAVMFATAGPALIHDYTSAGAAERASIVTTFSALYQIVVLGIWQTLEGIPAGVWLLGAGLSLYRARSRLLSLVPFAFGGIMLLLAVARMLG